VLVGVEGFGISNVRFFTIGTCFFAETIWKI
jgi:hypothetical protein